jgi:hypothetical protein
MGHDFVGSLVNLAFVRIDVLGCFGLLLLFLCVIIVVAINLNEFLDNNLGRRLSSLNLQQLLIVIYLRLLNLE